MKLLLYGIFLGFVIGLFFFMFTRIKNTRYNKKPRYGFYSVPKDNLSEWHKTKNRTNNYSNKSFVAETANSYIDKDKYD